MLLVETNMNSFAIENEAAGKKLPSGPLSLEVAWQVSPEHSVAIIDLTGKTGKNDLPLLATAPLPPIPLECCYL
jgi:hypothetical protein